MSKLDEIEKKYANWWEYEGTAIEPVLPDIRWLISCVKELEDAIRKHMEWSGIDDTELYGHIAKPLPDKDK